jgi:GNAT superfamily N-acetyltransferase
MPVMTADNQEDLLALGRKPSRTAALELRRATSDDGDAVLGLYENLGAESRYRRFFRATPRYDSGLRRHITDLASSVVWVAFDGERCVGEARIVTSSRQPCGDLAVTIADDYHGRGLGSRLARRVVGEHLRTNECVSFSILPGNTSAARMARRHGVRLQLDQGTLDGVVNRAAELPYDLPANRSSSLVNMNGERRVA